VGAPAFFSHWPYVDKRDGGVHAARSPTHPLRIIIMTTFELDTEIQRVDIPAKSVAKRLLL
jgi:hypothetical protein